MNVSQSECCPQTSNMGYGMIDFTSAPHKSVEWYLSLMGSLTYQTSLLDWALVLGAWVPIDNLSLHKELLGP